MGNPYDILIVGGGMVGASLALALRHQPLRIAVAEASPKDAVHPSFDARAIAFAAGSQRIFNGLGLWIAFEQEGVTPIRHIHVSDRGHFGSTRLSASEEGVEALGYVAEAAVIGRVMESALPQAQNVTLLRPAALTGLNLGADSVEAAFADGTTLRARLVVAADGGRSAVRQLLGEKALQLGYGQTGVIAYVTTDRSHDCTAYERFTDTGPLALLPCGIGGGAERRWSLVWTVRDDQVEEMLALDDASFLARLQERFGHRAGRFVSVSPRHAYPLSLHYLRDQVRERVVFIGNAAHTVHPVGGQGFNLGLRDVAALAEVITDAAHGHADVGARDVLQHYAQWRRADHARVVAFTDGLARAFSSRVPPLAWARDLGLLGLELMSPAKRLFARQAMGMIGRQPRLARGLALGG